MRVKSLISVVICIAYIVISAGFVLTGGWVSANEFLGRIFCDVDFEKPHSLEFVPKTNSITEEYDEDIETHYVKLSKSTNDDAYVQNRISQANHVVFEADIMVEKAAVSIYPFYFRTNASANYTAANISITPSLEVITHDNVHITNISAGDWHNFALAADFSEMEFDFYVDGIKVLYEHPMKSVTLGSTLTCRMRLPTGEGETVWGFDNFMIYEAYRKLSREEFDELATSIDRPSAYPSDDDVKEALSGRVALDLQSRLIFRSGEKVEPDVPALVKKGTTYVPVRVVSEGFDMEVSWDVITQQIKLGDDITLWVGRSAAKVGDEMVSLPAAPEIRRGRVLVPLRALSELILGKEVFWDGTSLIVIGDGEYEGSSDEDLLTRTREFMKYVRPDRTRIRNDFINAGSVGVHPRLMIKPEDVQRMKDLIDSKDPFMTEALNRLKNVCAGYLYAAPVEYQMSSSKLLGQSRLLLARAHALGLYYLLTGYEEYAEALYRNLESVANFPDWNHHTHFLDVGEMAAGFAIGYDSIYNYLTPERRDILSDALKRHCIIPAREAHYNSGLKYYNNWNSVVNGGVAMAALMLADEPGYEEIAFDTVAKSIRALEYMMPEFAPDGAWEESSGYRNLAVAYCMRMFSSLESACGTNYGLTRATGFSGTGEFAAYVHGPTGLYNYHDASYSKPDIIELFWLAKTLKRPDYAALRLYHLETFGLYKTPYDMMFYDPSYETAEGEILPLDGYFRNTELVSMRASWVDNQGIFVAAHGGYGKVPHWNLDSGTFVIDAMGERFAADLGSDSYDLPGYVNTQSHLYYRKRTEGQNCVVINPDESMGQVYEAFSPVETFETSDNAAYAIYNLSDAYAENAQSYRRGFMIGDGRKTVTIRDEINLKGEENLLYWFMQTEAVPEILSGNTVLLTKNKKRLLMEFSVEGGNTAEFLIMEAKPLPTSPNPDGQSSNDAYKRLAIKVTGSGEVDITVKFTPFDIKDEVPGFEPVELESWGQFVQ